MNQKEKKKKKEKKRKGNCNSFYLTYLPHGSAHWRDKGLANSKIL